MTGEIVVIPGDGTDTEAIPAAVDVLKAAGNFEFVEVDVGDHVKKETDEALPQETYDLAAETDATLFGAVDETVADVVLPLRTAVNSFVNVRPAKAYPSVDAFRPETDLVFLRESTEGVYSGHEDRLSEDPLTPMRVVTTSTSERLVEYTCDYVDGESGSFQVAYKASVMRETDGRLRDTAVAIADEHGVETEEVLMDAFAARVYLDPTQFDTIVCPDLVGDMLSDLTAGLVGGPGLLPSANIGPDAVLSEPVHSSAPDIAGEGIANPAATILSAAMLLDYLDHEAEVGHVRSAAEGVLADEPRAPDLGGDASMEDVIAAILDRLWASTIRQTGDSAFVSNVPAFASDRFLIDEHPVFVPVWDSVVSSRYSRNPT